MSSCFDPYKELQVYLEKAQEDIGRAFEDLLKSEVSSSEEGLVLPPPAFRTSHLDNYINGETKYKYHNGNAVEWCSDSDMSYNHSSETIPSFNGDTYTPNDILWMENRTSKQYTDGNIAFVSDNEKQLFSSKHIPMDFTNILRQEVTLPKNFKYGQKTKSQMPNLEERHCFNVEMQRSRSERGSFDNSKCCFIKEHRPSFATGSHSLSSRCSTHSLPTNLDENLLSLWVDKLVSEIDESFINEFNTETTSGSTDLGLVCCENSFIRCNSTNDDKGNMHTGKSSIKSQLVIPKTLMLYDDQSQIFSNDSDKHQGILVGKSSVPLSSQYTKLQSGIANFVAPPPPPEFDDINQDYPDNQLVNICENESTQSKKRSVNIQADKVFKLKNIGTTTSPKDINFTTEETEYCSFKNTVGVQSVIRNRNEDIKLKVEKGISDGRIDIREIQRRDDVQKKCFFSFEDIHQCSTSSCAKLKIIKNLTNFRSINRKEKGSSLNNLFSQNSKRKESQACSTGADEIRDMYASNLPFVRKQSSSLPDISAILQGCASKKLRKRRSSTSLSLLNGEIDEATESRDAVTQTALIDSPSRSSSFTWISECDCSEWESINARNCFEKSSKVFRAFISSEGKSRKRQAKHSSSLSSSTDEGNGCEICHTSDCSSLYLSAYSDAADSPTSDSSFDDISGAVEGKNISLDTQAARNLETSDANSTLNSPNFCSTSKGGKNKHREDIVHANSGTLSNNTEVGSMDFDRSILAPIAKSSSCGNAAYQNQLIELSAISNELHVKSMSMPLLRQKKMPKVEERERKMCLLPYDSVTDLISSKREFQLPEKVQTNKELNELQAIEACRWLRAAGFPQYAQMYDDNVFPIDVCTVQKDHAFLHPDSIQSLFRRLNILNRCVRMKFADNVPCKSIHLDESDEEEECALSENWEFQRVSRRWSRIPSPDQLSKEYHQRGRSPSPKVSKKNLSFKKCDDAYFSSHDSMFSEEQQSSPASIRRYGLRNDDRFLPVISLREGGNSPGSSSESGGNLSLVSDDTLEKRLDRANLRRSGSDRIKERAKALLRRMESLKAKKKKKTSDVAVENLNLNKLNNSTDGVSSCSSSLTSSPLLTKQSHLQENPVDDIVFNENDYLTINNKEVESGSHSDSDCPMLFISEEKNHSPLASRHAVPKPLSQSLRKEKVSKKESKAYKKSYSLRVCEKISSKMDYLSPTKNSSSSNKKQLLPRKMHLSPDAYYRHNSHCKELCLYDAQTKCKDVSPEGLPAPLVVFNNAYIDLIDKDFNEPGSSKSSSGFLSVQGLGDNDDEIIVISNKPQSSRDGLNHNRGRTPHRWHCFSNQTCPMDSTSEVIPLTNLSSSQILVLRKLSLLKLTTLMETYSPSSRTGWSWAVPKFIRRIRTPDYKDKLIFGVPLTVLLQRTGQPLPYAIQSAIHYLRKTALKSVGLFRKSGVKSRIQKLRNMTENKAESMKFDDQQAYDVADLMKQYFRELPEALLTNKLSDTFIAIFQYIPKELRLEAIQAAILLMPDENREVLQVLLAFLQEISEHSEENQMTATNLAVCFAPSLFQLSSPRSSSVSPRRRKTVGAPDMRELNENKAAYECLASMIANYEELCSISKNMITESELTCLTTCEPATLDQVSHLLSSDSSGWKMYIDDCVQALIKEVNNKYKGWINVSQSENVDLSYKKSDDGYPLRLWKVSAEVEAPPTELLSSILRERHVWDLSFIKWKVIQTLEKQTEVLQFLIDCSPPHPSCDYCIIRSWKTDLIKGSCVLIEASIDHSEASPLMGSVRAIILASRYLIEPCGSGKSRITHISRVDTKGRSIDWYNRAYGHLCSLNIIKLRDYFSHVCTDGPETKV